MPVTVAMRKLLLVLVLAPFLVGFVTVAELSDIAPEVTTVLNNLLPNRGDLLVRSATGVQKLPLGPAGTVLGSNGTDLVYVPQQPGGGGGGGGGTGDGVATAVQTPDGAILDIGPIALNEQLVRGINNTLQGRPLGMPFKVTHPGSLESTDQNTWTPINFIGTPPGDSDLSIPSAVRVFYMIRYRADVAAGIKFHFLEGPTISYWNGWGPIPGSTGKQSQGANGDGERDWGGTGMGDVHMMFIYAARDGAAPFTLQFARYGTSGVAEVLTGSFAMILRANEDEY